MAHRMLLLSLIVCAGLNAAAMAEDLEIALHTLKQQILSESTSFREAIIEHEALAEEFSEPEERGRIYVALIDIYAGTQGGQPGSLVNFAKKALSYPLDPLSEMRMYLNWGVGLDMIHRGREQRFTAEGRNAVLIPYLQGLKVALDQDLPDSLPELPRPYGLRGGGSLYEEAKKENEKRLEAWNTNKELKALIEQREMLERSVYFLIRNSPEDIEEVRKLAMEYLDDRGAVEELIQNLQDPKRYLPPTFN